jgi:hypothetical protein
MSKRTVDVRLLIDDSDRDQEFILDQLSRLVGVAGVVELVNRGFGDLTPDPNTLNTPMPWDGREVLPEFPKIRRSNRPPGDSEPAEPA